MTFDEAKDALKRGYQDSGVKLMGEAADSLFFNFQEETLQITRGEIEEYARNRDLLVDATSAPVECSYSTFSIREQLIKPLDPIGAHSRFWMVDRQYLFRGNEAQPYLFTAGRVRLGNGWGLDIGAWT